MTHGQPRSVPAIVVHARNPLRSDRAPITENTQLRDLVQTLGGDASTLPEPFASGPVSLWRVRRGATLLHEGAPAQAVYVLRTGSLKCIRTLEDGYEQVLSFAQPGDLLGFEALHCGHQPAGAVALEDVTVFALPWRELRAWRGQCTALDQVLELALSRQLMRAAGTAELMSAVAADARLARFLLWMTSRRSEAGLPTRRLFLRMCRRDIASLLGVAHETISRSFTLLGETGLIRVHNREVEILDLEGLRERARSTRRPVEEPARAGRQAPNGLTTTRPAAWFPLEGALPAAA